MTTVTTSPKFQVVIPQAIREARGMLAGIETSVPREHVAR